jgi:hypothetical protein
MAIGRLPRAERGQSSATTVGRAAALRRAPATRRSIRLFFATVLPVLSVLPASPALAQDTVVVRPGRLQARGPRGVAQWAVDLFNAPGTTRAFGAFTVDRDQSVLGDVAVVDGPVTVLGTISGDLVAVNADVVLGEGALVEGDVVVLGGILEDDPAARVMGTLRRQSERPEVRREGDRLVLVGRPRVTEPERRWRSFYDRSRGDAFIVLGIGGTYNRVEGLPLRLGAGVEWTTGPIEGRIRGYGVFRTAGDFKGNRQDIGYQAEGEITLGHRPRLTVGGRAFDLVVPTQEWPLTRHEVGWASLLWHRDYRDYFLQRGLSGFLRFEPAPGLSLAGEVAQVEETSIPERDPWTPVRNAEPWRPNPIVDQGDFTLLRGTLEFDDRDGWDRHGWDSGGWLLRATWEHGLGENVVERPLGTAVRDPLPATGYTFDRVSADFRRYQQIGWGGELRVRGFFAGTVGDGPLPVQRRFSLGGPDPMNGYAFRAIACNAGVADPALPGLCDRVLLFQAQYRGGFGFDWLDFDGHDRHDRRGGVRGWDWDWGIDGDWFDFEGPSLVLFSNAGTGWIASRSSGIPALSWDVGAGIEMGSVGFYAAKAIRSGEPVRLTLRIERRF